MARYLLTGIDDDQWSYFKAACDLQKITIKESLLSYIDHTVSDFQSHPKYTQGWPKKQNKKGIKK